MVGEKPEPTLDVTRPNPLAALTATADF